MPSIPRTLSIFARQVTPDGGISLSGSPTFGDSSADTVTFNASTISAPNGLNFDANTLVIDSTNNRVGIGTTTPGTVLHIKATAGGTDPAVVTGERVRIQSNDVVGRSTYMSLISGTSAYSGIIFGNQDAADIGKILYYNSNNSLQFHVNGAERIRIDSAGYLGVNNNSPAEVLDVTGNIKLSGELRGPATFVIDPAAVGDNTGTVVIKGDLQVDGATTTINSTTLTVDDKNIVIADGASTTATIDTAGIDFGTTAVRLRYNYNSGTNSGLSIEGTNVGIGTTAPAYRLESWTTGTGTSAGDNTTLLVSSNGSGRDVNIRFGDNVNASARIGYLSGNMYFLTNGAERMRIDTAGNVGIGTSSPTSILHLSAASSPTLQVVDTTNNVTGVVSSGNTEAYFGTTSNHPSVFLTNNTERMRIDSSGNVGIGTSSPNRKLEVSGATSNADSGMIRSSNAADTTYYKEFGRNNSTGNFDIRSAQGSTATTQLTLDSSGNLGLGVTPSAWGFGTAIQVGSYGNLWDATEGSVYLTNNAYFDGGSWRRKNANYATLYSQIGGGHGWRTAASDTAGSAISFTQAMTLDASGNLLLGSTSNSGGLGERATITGYGLVTQSAAATNRGMFGTFGGTDLLIGGFDSAMSVVFRQGNTERMRIDSSGNVGIGTSTQNERLRLNSSTAGEARLTIAYGGTAITYFGSYSGITGSGSATDTFLAATGALVFGAGSTVERMRIDSSGNVGIGVAANSGVRLYVLTTGQTALAAGISGVAQLNIGNGGASINYYDANTQIFRSGGGTEQMRLTSTGLGIGTSSPATKLDVAGSGDLAGRVSTTGTSNAASIILQSGNGTTSGLFAYARFINNDTNSQDWRIGTFGTNNFSIVNSKAGTVPVILDTSGNLGIGVTPSAGWSGYKAIQVGLGSSFGGYGLDLLAFVGSNIYNDNTNWRYILSGNAASRYQQSAGAHAWYTAPSGTAGNAISFTQAMTLDASGNLLLGTTSLPSGRRFIIEGSGDTAGRINSAGASSGLSIEFANNGTLRGGIGNGSGNITAGNAADFAIQATNNLVFASGGYAERMRIDSSGNLLVGTTNANPSGSGSAGRVVINTLNGGQAALTCYNAGTGAVNIVSLENGNGQVGRIQINGTATSYLTSSDYRLKENIQPMAGALEKVAQLNPVTYTWKVDGSDGQGFIAHELQAVVPDCVGGEKDAVDAEGKPVYQGIDTSFLVATLTKAIQEQQEQINQLTTRVAQLEGTK